MEAKRIASETMIVSRFLRDSRIENSRTLQRKVISQDHLTAMPLELAPLAPL